MAAILLRGTANVTQLITDTLVHPNYFPYSLGLALHAARVSIAYQSNVRNTGNWERIPWATYLAGFLIMSWGGSVWSHILLGLHPPQLYSVHPWISYLSIHLLLTGIFPHIQSALSPRTLDTLLFPMDSVLRLTSITASLSFLQSHPDPRLSQSLFLQLIIGAVASAGGGATAATLGVWTPDWKFNTPMVLTSDLVGTTDVWGGMVTAFTYGLLTASHPTHQYLLQTLSITSNPGPVLSPLGARAAATILLAVIFLWRVLIVHWVGRATPKQVKEKSQ